MVRCSGVRVGVCARAPLPALPAEPSRRQVLPHLVQAGPGLLQPRPGGRQAEADALHRQACPSVPMGQGAPQAEATAPPPETAAVP